MNETNGIIRNGIGGNAVNEPGESHRNEQGGNALYEPKERTRRQRPVRTKVSLSEAIPAETLGTLQAKSSKPATEQVIEGAAKLKRDDQNQITRSGCGQSENAEGHGFFGTQRPRAVG